MDNSPPQLVVDERSTEPGVIPSPDALTASVNTFIGTTNESNEQLSSIICDLCSKTFPSKFLLHIHMTNVHGIQQSTSVSNGTTTTIAITNNNNNNKTQLINIGIKKPLTNGNNTVRLKQTPQVQLRVTCQVCKKVSFHPQARLLGFQKNCKFIVGAKCKPLHSFRIRYKKYATSKTVIMT
jgi:hypothetical protein